MAQDAVPAEAQSTQPAESPAENTAATDQQPEPAGSEEPEADAKEDQAPAKATAESSSDQFEKVTCSTCCDAVDDNTLDRAMLLAPSTSLTPRKS